MTCRALKSIAVCALVTTACSEPSQRSFRLPTAPTQTTLPPARPAPPPTLPPPSYPPPAGPRYVPGSGVPVGAGDAVTFSIVATDVACYTEWDMTGRCRLFELTPARDGEATINVRRTVPLNVDILDVFVVPTEGPALIAFTGYDWEQAILPVMAGRSYGIFVMTYSFPQEFSLTVDLH